MKAKNKRKRETIEEEFHRRGLEFVHRGISPAMARAEIEAARRPKFPIKLKVFLRLVIGGRSEVNRTALFRKFCEQEARNNAVWSTNPEHKTLEGIQNWKHGLIAMLTANGVDEGRFRILKDKIIEWRTNAAIEQRRNAAKSRWGKK